MIESWAVDDADRHLLVAARTAIERLAGTGQVTRLAAGERGIRRQLGQLEPQATESVWSFSTRIDGEAIEAAGHLVRQSERRGVDVQVRVDHRGLAPDVRLADVPDGYHLRTGTVHRPLLLIDSRAVVWLEPDADLGAVAWLITDRVTLRAARRLRGVVEESVRLGALGVSARQERVMALLLEGLTDEGVAQRLGVSRRTVTHDITGLQEMLGATNRTDLGYRWALRRLNRG